MKVRECDRCGEQFEMPDDIGEGEYALMDAHLAKFGPQDIHQRRGFRFKKAEAQ